LKLAVIGSRTWTNQYLLEKTLTDICIWMTNHMNDDPVTEIISGGAGGADSIAEAWARGVGKRVTVYKADWNLHGRSAGPIRNSQIIAACDAVLAFVVAECCPDCSGTGCNGAPLIYQKCNPCQGCGWLPTRGTADSLRKAKAAGKPCWVVTETEGEVREW
jgi:hypothetical protein